MIAPYVFGGLTYWFFMAAVNASSSIYLTLSLVFSFYLLVVIPQQKYVQNNQDDGGTE